MGARTKTHKPRIVKIAGKDIESFGLSSGAWKDISHRAITARWSIFVAAILGIFLVANCLFAMLYYASADAIANTNGSFLHCFYFSIETLTTVGYGDMHPQSNYGHVIASIELFTGTLGTAIVTGLIFYRFSLPQARILFAKVATIHTFDGKKHLMVRVANERQNSISNATAKIWLARKFVTSEGELFHRFDELKLTRSQSPLFVLSWTIMHLIDEASPLHAVTAEKLEKMAGSLLVTVDGFDETTSQAIHARANYLAAQIKIGERYAGILEELSHDRYRLNYQKFHTTIPE